MSTMNQMADQVLSEVYGYTATIDASTSLMSAVDGDDLTFTVADASQFSRGIVQIDNELILISGVDRNNNTLTCASTQGRGVRATTAASHSTGALVTMSPSIPRQQVIDALYQTLRSSNGLFAVATTTFTYEAMTFGYDLPADVDTVLSVSWLPTGSTNEYIRVKRWTHDKYNGMLFLGEGVQPNITVKVAYSKEPTAPTIDQDFTVSGLPASCEDVIRFGAAWRLVSFIEQQNLLDRNAEADAMTRNQQQQGARLRIAQYLFQMYRQRLDEEVANLQSKYPIRSHYGG